MTWTTAELRTLILSLPPGIPSPKRKAFARSVSRATDDYLAAQGAGWTPGKGGSRAAAYDKDLAVARRAIIAVENGKLPPPISDLSSALQQRIENLEISAQDKATLRSYLAVAGLRRIVESKGRGKTRVRWDIRLLGEVGPGRIRDDEGNLLMWRIGRAWTEATGHLPTSRHDWDVWARTSPIAAALDAVKSVRPSAISATPQTAARMLGEIRARAA